MARRRLLRHSEASVSRRRSTDECSSSIAARRQRLLTDCRFRPKRVRAQLRSRRPEWQPRALGWDSQMALCARLPAGLARPGPGSGCPHLSPGEGCRLPVACVSDSTASLRQTPRVSFDEQPRCGRSPRLPGATAPRQPERVDGLLAPGGAGIRRRERRRTLHSGPGRRRALCHGAMIADGSADRRQGRSGKGAAL